MRTKHFWLAILLTAIGPLVSSPAADSPLALVGTQPLNMQGDLSAQMVAGIDQFLMRKIDQSIAKRPALWHRDLSSRAAYEASVSTNRADFRRIIGAIDPRVPIDALEMITSTLSPPKIGETEKFTIFAVRWPVLEGVTGEGLLLVPKGFFKARVVAIPDADQTPEMIVGLAPGLAPESQFARRLAEAGCEVLVPVLIDRKDTWSGNASFGKFTNQPHREWIYRQAYELGRHIIGYEVQRVLAAVEFFALENATAPTNRVLKIGVAGYGEGGLIAFYASALDTRVDATLVSGYFGSRQRVWEEPIYRNVCGLLDEFGDAEIASLIAPRALVIEHSEAPKIDGPPKPSQGRIGAAPGKIVTPEFAAVEGEARRSTELGGGSMNAGTGKESGLAGTLAPPAVGGTIRLVSGKDGATVPFGSADALNELLQRLGVPAIPTVLEPGRAGFLKDVRRNFNPDDRLHRQFIELQNYTQKLLLLSERERAAFFWNKTKPSPTNNWTATCKSYHDYFWDDVIGHFPAATLPPNPRTRRIYDRPLWTGYEVVLDVWPEVYAWGYLLLPKDLKPGERRPVVVCQHGLEGLPADTINGPGESGYPAYKSFAARLAEQGYVVFAPHNPYRGKDAFRVLQRKANPLKKSLFSVIVAQHDRILDFLSEQPFVDPKRIGFYGLSYGGKSAMRIPALLDRYCLSICAADFNDWITKCATVDAPYGYLFTGEYEMDEWNLGETFNYAEMAALIAPRPFMVERGHLDGVAPDEWVAHEYATIRRMYAFLGIPDRTAIEFFNGPHTINGQGTFEFLHRHLNWPAK